MKYLLISLWLLIALMPCAHAGNDSLLTALSNTIRSAAEYDAAKIKEINQLKLSLDIPVHDRYEQIYHAYKVFNYDSAYSYALKLIQLSTQMQAPRYIIAAKLQLSFVLLSAGLYKEAYDSLSAISGVPADLRGEYYTLWGRYYYDLAGYANDNYHSVDYDIKGNAYLDSALIYYPPKSFEYNYYSGLKYFKQGNIQQASSFFEKLITTPLTDHQLALTASTLSGIQNNIDKATDLLVQATIADIRSSTKETVAIFHLAELLYKQNDLRHASMCIESAISNAEFYGARQRKLQASSILPLIEGERINGIEAQKALLLKYAVIVTLLLLTLVMLARVILKQVKKLKLAQQAQQTVNLQLEEASKIKEEYIGYFFNMDSEFYSKLDKIKSTIEQKLQEKRYEDIRFFLNKIDARKEKEELLLSFDKIFLKLFPGFLMKVNALLREEEKICLKDGELMTTDLRIFALMRMGITDPEKIARILEYSVKTIYSYKSRIKNKAAMPGEEFEARIMQIKAV
jgi:hypothetical protein